MQEASFNHVSWRPKTTGAYALRRLERAGRTSHSRADGVNCGGARRYYSAQDLT
jgi:hypothetical protein